MERVGVGVDCSSGGGAGFEDCAVEEGWFVGVVEEVVSNLKMGT